jgi:DNA polymerase III epsilon subunit-like protein
MSNTPDIRLAIAEALYPNSASLLPAICERFGLPPGARDEAMNSKRTYVDRWLVLCRRHDEELATSLVGASASDGKRKSTPVSP